MMKITIKVNGKSVNDHEGPHNNIDDDDDNNSEKQMVLYDPSLNGSDRNNADQISVTKKVKSSKGPPEVGAFTVQCANCFKWRLIPDQEKYEVIREHITDQPFLCETTHEWGRSVSCEDPSDIEQDGTRIWAIDKPNIAQPPPGWKRLLRLRKEGGAKFADVYYTSPTGAKLRSLPEVEKYLSSHPEHAQGIELGRFSFQIPKPLNETYVRKRPSVTPAPMTLDCIELSPVEPIAWARPDENSTVQMVEPLRWANPENRNGTPPSAKTPDIDSTNQAAKKAKIDDFSCV
ncbi:methyl-CpG-binding domain-containing protein 2-like [Rutidosis leptorrhynchoides]|uniref:methyl-CpG-binding domain-containing protein 2-like n=1 Tax=Rutidosis leptorrhynchoides TaxID=125765 RepID=UPI003A9A1D1C